MIIANLISPHPARGADLSPKRGEKIIDFLWSTKGAAGLASPWGEARDSVVRGGNFLTRATLYIYPALKGTSII